jgi:hypothetical protein
MGSRQTIFIFFIFFTHQHAMDAEERSTWLAPLCSSHCGTIRDHGTGGEWQQLG